MPRPNTVFCVALLNALIFSMPSGAVDEASRGLTPVVARPSQMAPTTASAEPVVTLEFQFDRAIATKKARAYLVEEFGPEDLTKHWKLDTPEFAAVQITAEEAHNNCWAAGRFVIVGFARVDLPPSGIFIIFNVAASGVWGGGTYMGGQMSMPEVVKNLRTGEGCC